MASLIQLPFIAGVLGSLFLASNAPDAVIYQVLTERTAKPPWVQIGGLSVGDWLAAVGAGAHPSYEFDLNDDGKVEFGFYTTIDGITASGVYASPGLAPAPPLGILAIRVFRFRKTVSFFRSSESAPYEAPQRFVKLRVLRVDRREQILEFPSEDVHEIV